MDGYGKFPQYEIPYWGGKIAGWDRMVDEKEMVAFQSKHHSDTARSGISRALGTVPNSWQYWVVRKGDLDGFMEKLKEWAKTTIPE